MLLEVSHLASRKRALPPEPAHADTLILDFLASSLQSMLFCYSNRKRTDTPGQSTTIVRTELTQPSSQISLSLTLHFPLLTNPFPDWHILKICYKRGLEVVLVNTLFLTLIMIRLCWKAQSDFLRGLCISFFWSMCVSFKVWFFK
jgi:hypothetical protein